MTDFEYSSRSLGGRYEVHVGRLPQDLVLQGAAFEDLWSSRPDVIPTIRMYGREVLIPRWQQAYLRDYRFSGQTSQAAELLPSLEPLLAWVRAQIDDRFNGVLANWYDGHLGHYIGPHHDDSRQLVPGTPIVTISFGQPRTFRMRRPKQTGFYDIETDWGMVIIMPWETNKALTHEIVKSRRPGRRISITLRCFK